MKTLPFARSLLCLRLAPPLLISSLALLAAQPAAAAMKDLGNYPGATGTLRINGVSGDGKLVVGRAPVGSMYEPFYWSAGRGFSSLGSYFDIDAMVSAASSDGRFMAGTAPMASDNSKLRAYRWDAAGASTVLGTLGGDNSAAYGISDDGAVVVGAADTTTSSHAFRWVAGAMQGLGTLAAGESSAAQGVSGDGKIVVGWSGSKAFRWDAASGLQDLGTLGGSVTRANATNSDGSVVVGAGTTAGAPYLHAFRWTSLKGMEDLGTLGGRESIANDVNADGSVVVGFSNRNSGVDRAFRWTAATGMTDLGVLSGTLASYAAGVSDDGNTIVGTSDDRAFIWTASFVAPVVDSVVARVGIMQDLSYLQTSLIRSADTVNHLVTHQTRRLRDLTAQQCQPGTNQTYCLGGGAQRYAGGADSSDHQNDLLLAGGLRLNEQFTAGATLSVGGSELKDQDAKQKKAFGLGLWSAYQQNQDNTGWGGSASVAMGNSDNSFERGVGLTDVQRARGNLKMSSTALRVAANYGVQMGASLVTPEVALTHARTGQDGFTERNVAFPLTVDSSKSSQTFVTTGVSSATPVNPKGTLHMSLALDTLLQDHTPAIEGRSQVPGLSEFKLDGSADKRRVVPVAMVGYSHALDENSTVGGGVQLSGASYQGDKAVVGVGVNYGYAF